MYARSVMRILFERSGRMLTEWTKDRIRLESRLVHKWRARRDVCARARVFCAVLKKDDVTLSE